MWIYNKVLNSLYISKLPNSLGPQNSKHDESTKKYPKIAKPNESPRQFTHNFSLAHSAFSPLANSCVSATTCDVGHATTYVQHALFKAGGNRACMLEVLSRLWKAHAMCKARGGEIWLIHLAMIQYINWELLLNLCLVIKVSMSHA